jgi:alkylation response protein AidB-like acyl-CoA dehydrogenase
MDVRLSPEQRALREAVAHLVDRFGPRTVEALDEPERVAKLDAAINGAGWRELRAAGGDGFPFASAVEAALVAEELARGLADSAFIGPTLAADLRRVARAPAAPRAETVALGPPLDGLASHDGLAVDAHGCTAALVGLHNDGHRELGLVQLSDTRRAVDLTRHTATASAPAEPISEGTHPISDEDLLRWRALGIALTCADLVGVMRGATSLATDYAAARRQYGVAVGSFQAVQHLLADARVATEGSHSAALHAAWSVDALAPQEAVGACALAKAYCSRAAISVCETAIQVHGGFGNTWECLAHVFLRRALFAIDMFGGVGPNLERVLAHHGIGAPDGLR